MIDRFEEEAAVATDAYIDWLLDARNPAPRPLDEPPAVALSMQRTIAILHSRLPRFHPSFAFEEQLAARLRAAAVLGEAPDGEGGQILRFTIHPPAATAVAARRLDPRVLIGGAAIASGVSMAAAYAWRRAARRPRRNTGVPA
jgi:hypothetical protein